MMAIPLVEEHAQPSKRKTSLIDYMLMMIRAEIVAVI